MIRLLMEQKKEKKTKRFGEEGMNLLPCGEAHIQEVTGGGCGRERAKSDRLAYESTHRRTLFNVSLTFLFSISDPRSLEERAERKSQEERERGRDREDRRRQRSACITQGHEPQTKSGVGVHRRASQSGRGRVREASHFTPRPSSSFICLFIFFFILPPTPVGRLRHV